MPSSALFTKLNLKDQSEIVVLNAPQSFETELEKKINKLAQGDAVVWFAYPKSTSKRYKCEINRDTGWSALGAVGFESVRLVAIDEDWSAKRLRRVEFIKTMKRDSAYAMSRAGKVQTTKTKK